MNEEQKAIAGGIFYMFGQEHIAPVEALNAMAALLQELVDMPAQSVTGEELQAAFDRGLKAGNEQNDAQQVEIHRLHDLLAAAPTPAEAHPDDAAPTPPEPPADAAHELTLSSLRKKLGLPEHCAERRILCAIDELIAKQVPADVAQDAERYRAIRGGIVDIRDCGNTVAVEYKSVVRYCRSDEDFDQEIDAAIKRQGGES